MTQSFGPFLGLYTTLLEQVPPGYAGSLLNVRMADGTIRPRFGFRNLSAAAGGVQAVHGLDRLFGYDGAYASVEEWLSIENRSGTVKPYAIDPATYARTEIKDGTTALALAGGDWRAFCFDSFAYVCNPDSPVSVYRHAIGDETSWTAVEGLAGGTPPTLPGLATHETSAPPYTEHQVFVSGTDTVAATVDAGSVTTDIAASDGLVHVHQFNTSDGKHWAEVTITLATARNIGAHVDALLWRMRAGAAGASVGDSFNDDATSNRVELINSASVSSGVLPATVAGDRLNAKGPGSSYYAWADLSGVSAAILSDVKKIKIRFGTFLNSGGMDAYLIELKAGGVRYHDQTGSFGTDSEQNVSVLEYAYNYTEGATVGPARKLRVAAQEHLGQSRYYGSLPYAGSEQSVTVPQPTDGAWTAAAKINLYRLVGASYQRIKQQVNTDRLNVVDTLSDTVVAADTVAYPVTALTFDETDLADPGTEFDSRACVGGFSYKGGVCWLYKGGRQNVRYSRVGEPEEQSAETDEEDDTNRGATYSLADNYADEPLGGAQCGDVAVILGRQGVYGQAGDVPSAMTPTRKLPGGLGCAGRFAYTRFKSDSGEPGVVFLDAAGEGIWFVGASQVFADQAAARPVELTASIRGYARRFLLDEQAAEFGFTDLSAARMDVDEATGTLWVVMGKRALLLRPPNPGDGARQWEAHEYTLADTCTDTVEPSGVAVSEARTGSTDAWANANWATASDEQRATSGPLGFGDKTQHLYAPGLSQSTALPAGAVVDTVTVEVEASATGEMQVLDDSVLVTKAGVAIGANMATLAALPADDGIRQYQFDVEGLGVTAADVAAGSLGLKIGYKAEPTESAVFDAANWAVSYAYSGATTDSDGGTTAWAQTPAGGSRSCNAAIPGVGTATAESTGTVTVYATWIGSGSPPAYAVLSVTSRAEYTVAGSTTSGSAANGLGTAAVGGVSEGTARRRVDVVGGIATTQVVTSASASGTETDPFGEAAASASIQVSAGVSAPTAATARVDSVRSYVCYSGAAGASEGISAKYLAFSPQRKLVWLRSSGDLDEAEWNSALRSYIEGSQRDGGRTMPDGHWESGETKGRNRRLSRVHVEREDPSDAVEVAGYCDRVPAGATSSLPEDRGWGRFGVSQIGKTHRLRFLVPEDLSGVASAEAEFVPVSEALLR